MTNDGINTLTYDAENHVVSSTSGSGSGTYTYDGNGQRVIKVGGGNTIVTIFAGAQVLAEYYNGALPSAPTNEYIYAGSLKVASIQSGGTNYWHNDHLSPRVRTDTSGNVSDERGTFPFGETWYSPGASPYMYTTYYRDYEAAGNDYAQARTFVGGLGRFSSPDPISGSTSDPQSLNRYSYVRNMPVMFADPFGTCPPVVENRDPDKNQSQDSESGGGPYVADFSDPAAPDPEAPPQGTPGGCGTPPWYYTMGGGGGDGALGGGTGGGLVSIDGGEGFAPGDGGWGLTGIGTDPFSILDAAFTPTSYQTVDNPDCPNGDCPGGVGDESITVPVYGNLGLLSLLGGPGGNTSGGNNSPQKTKKCSGSARVLQGNANTIGKPEGFSGPSAGNILVTANGAAVIPSQFGGKGALRPYLSQISGVFPNVNASFQGVVDVIGGAPPPGFPPNSNVQTDLMSLNPGNLILELPGAPKDYGVTAVTLTIPAALNCPTGTTQVP